MHIVPGKYLPILGMLWMLSPSLKAQEQQADSILQHATLPNVISYALQRQPGIQQSLLDERITRISVNNKLSDWYPQIQFNGSLQHNTQLQSSSIGGNIIQLGVRNTSAGQFLATQQLLNRDLILASITARNVKQQAEQNTESRRIELVVNVSKAFYDVLATEQQVLVASENIARLERSLKDAYSQYEAGTADKTDYKRATIALNNTRAALESNRELLAAKKEYLKFLIGYPPGASIDIEYDVAAMENDIVLDTTQRSDYRNRIEYRMLQTGRNLQLGNLKYSKLAYMPSLYASGSYSLFYLNNDFRQLYVKNYPISFVALNLSIPIFQGPKRWQGIQQQKLQLQRIDYDIENLENAVNSEYTQALALYRSNLASYNALKENMEIAREVYDVIEMQYRSGVKTYLEVITAETDLRTARINYYNALYQLLSARIDVQRAQGRITP